MKVVKKRSVQSEENATTEVMEEIHPRFVDSIEYNNKLIALANGDTTGLWPVKDQPLPLHGAIYPNTELLLTTAISILQKWALGEYAPQEMWRRLNTELKAWKLPTQVPP